MNNNQSEKTVDNNTQPSLGITIFIVVITAIVLASYIYIKPKHLDKIKNTTFGKLRILENK